MGRNKKKATGKNEKFDKKQKKIKENKKRALEGLEEVSEKDFFTLRETKKNKLDSSLNSLDFEIFDDSKGLTKVQEEALKKITDQLIVLSSVATEYNYFSRKELFNQIVSIIDPVFIPNILAKLPTKFFLAKQKKEQNDKVFDYFCKKEILISQEKIQIENEIFTNVSDDFIENIGGFFVLIRILVGIGKNRSEEIGAENTKALLGFLLRFSKKELKEINIDKIINLLSNSSQLLSFIKENANMKNSDQLFFKEKNSLMKIFKKKFKKNDDCKGLFNLLSEKNAKAYNFPEVFSKKPKNLLKHKESINEYLNSYLDKSYGERKKTFNALFYEYKGNPEFEGGAFYYLIKDIPNKYFVSKTNSSRHISIAEYFKITGTELEFNDKNFLIKLKTDKINWLDSIYEQFIDAITPFIFWRILTTVGKKATSKSQGSLKADKILCCLYELYKENKLINLNLDELVSICQINGDYNSFKEIFDENEINKVKLKKFIEKHNLYFDRANLIENAKLLGGKLKESDNGKLKTLDEKKPEEPNREESKEFHGEKMDIELNDFKEKAEEKSLQDYLCGSLSFPDAGKICEEYSSYGNIEDFEITSFGDAEDIKNFSSDAVEELQNKTGTSEKENKAPENTEIYFSDEKDFFRIGGDLLTFKSSSAQRLDNKMEEKEKIKGKYTGEYKNKDEDEDIYPDYLKY